MKLKHIFIFFISPFLMSIPCSSQEIQKETTSIKKDSIIMKDIYGIRAGIDVFNPINTIFNTDRKSLEFVVDYRLTKKIYIAAEIGYLDNKINEDYYNLQTKGEYIKLGANYNMYENWFDMDNEVYLGLRYGFSLFSQTVDNVSINSDNSLPDYHNFEAIKYSDLNAHWAELVTGMKAEIYKNLYLGFSFSLKRMITNKQPENFKNIYAPGFNRIYLNNGGFGFNYTVSYRLPLYKKNKIPFDKYEIEEDSNKASNIN